jgi:hypothetical protein
MKPLMFLLSLFTFSAFACDDNYLAGQTDAEKFLVAADQADFVYFGKVVRLFQLPDTPSSTEGYNGFVFQVEEIVKGETGNFMELEKLPWCGVNKALMEGYWPDEFGQEYVVAVKRYNDIDYLIAVLPREQAHEAFTNVEVKGKNSL